MQLTAQTTGVRAFLDLLKQEGVEFMFGNPGTTELRLMDELAIEGQLRYVLALQECVAMAMADGYAQASGKLASVNLHLAPGLGNAMGLLYDAAKAGSPLIVTAGQLDQKFNFTEPFLWGDLPVVARPFVKWSAEVRRFADLPRAIHRAAKTALTPPTGPVFLSIPVDILDAEGELDLGHPTRIATIGCRDEAAFAAAADLLASAAHPVIMAGDAVAQNRAHAELVALAELLGASVYTEPVPSSASFPASHPLFRGARNNGTVWSGAAVREVVQQHDVLLSAGADLFTLSMPSALDPMPEGTRVIHLDNDPWELGKNYPEEVAIFGNLKSTLADLTAALQARMTPRDRERAQARFAANRAAAAADLVALKAEARAGASQQPIPPLSLMAAIAKLLPPEAVVVDESISSGRGVRQLLPSDDPQSFYGLRGGGLGWGLSAAVGVKLALPNRPVVALIGDGSAMYGNQGLWSAAKANVAVIFVILNNAGYRVLKDRTRALQRHTARTGTYVGMDLDEPAIDFVGLARALGVAAERATTLDEVRTFFSHALTATGPVLLDVRIDPAY